MKPRSDVFHHSFFEDACATMAKNVRDLLKLAGLPATHDAILKIVTSLPRVRSQFDKDHPWHHWYFNRTMTAVDEAHRDTPASGRLQELGNYFIAFADRNPADQDQLIAAFTGVLSQEWEA